MGWVLFARQDPGLPDRGPLTPALKAMSARDSNGQPVSPPGAEISRMIDVLGVKVAFLPTQGSGITPWRRQIVLDRTYRGEAQAASAQKVGLIAHELAHLLQRELDDPYYWPSGGIRPSLSWRWVGDSTNYMEALAYAVGWTVEADLRRAAGGTPASLNQLADHLATLTAPDAGNAARYVVSLFPTNPIYRQNFRREARLADGRIPPGGWRHWLGQMGFAGPALDHIESFAAQGAARTVTVEEIEGLIGPA